MQIVKDNEKIKDNEHEHERTKYGKNFNNI